MIPRRGIRIWRYDMGVYLALVLARCGIHQVFICDDGIESEDDIRVRFINQQALIG